MQYTSIGHLTMEEMGAAIDAMGGEHGVASYLKDAGCRPESISAVMEAVRNPPQSRSIELWWTEDAMCRIVRKDISGEDSWRRNHKAPDAAGFGGSWWRGRIDHDIRMISMVPGSAYHSEANVMVLNEIEKARERVVSRLKSLHPDYSVYCFDVGTANGVLAS